MNYIVSVVLKWIKENLFDWQSVPPSRFSRPPVHDPGYKNRRRAKAKK